MSKPKMTKLETQFNDMQKCIFDLQTGGHDYDGIVRLKEAMKELLAQNAPKVMVNTYGTWQEFENRESAQEFFKRCMFGSEGSERDRYVNVLRCLENPKCVMATDAERM